MGDAGAVQEEVKKMVYCLWHNEMLRLNRVVLSEAGEAERERAAYF